MKAKLALAFINLKSGSITRAAELLDNITEKYPKKVYQPYPIQVSLKQSMFNPEKAQQNYRRLVDESKILDYQKIFYFSPYKLFNANKTINDIKKGNANIFIDNMSSAKKYLKKSSSSSNVNLGIVKSVQKALNLRTREANVMLQKLSKIQPKHSIVRYNLALTYAQMGDIVQAQKHFLDSYHIDAKNYLSGIYSIMCSQLIHKDYTKLMSIIYESISQEKDSQEIRLYKTLLQLVQNNTLAMLNWLDNKEKKRPLYLALDVIIALKLNKTQIAKKSVNKLIAIQKNNILPHIMYIDVNFNNFDNIEYAREVQNYLKKQKFKFDDLYYGPYITRFLYIQQNLITGKLYFVRQQIKKVLEATQENTHELNSALALASLYDGAFEESYSLYNNLVDNLKVRDARTIFLAGVASIAASHHPNAIALLQLSILKDKYFFESRYALGLLYLEVKNNKGAIVQFSKIDIPNFNSEYFNFDINLDELTYEKMHPNE
jgi:thioredoxin-like negative regulator of GroEL